MNNWPLLLLLIFICYFCWTAFGAVLLNKEVFIKRINPIHFNLIGDLTFKENIIKAKFKWKVRAFSVQQILKIKAYSLTDWGLSEHEQVDILFDDKFKAVLNGSLEEHQQLTKILLNQLGVEHKILDWGFLPQLNDKMYRDIIFEKNNIR